MERGSDGPILSTTLWGHDYLPTLYGPPEPASANDESGFYFATRRSSSPCGISPTAGPPPRRTFSPGEAGGEFLAAFTDEDETFEHFIANWKNDGGDELDGFSWFLNGTMASETTSFRSREAISSLKSSAINFCSPSLPTKRRRFCGTAALGIRRRIRRDARSLLRRRDRPRDHRLGFELDGRDIYLYISDSTATSGPAATTAGTRRTVSRIPPRLEFGDGRYYLSGYIGQSDVYVGDFTALRSSTRHCGRKRVVRRCAPPRIFR